jgi:amino acid transporter
MYECSFVQTRFDGGVDMVADPSHELRKDSVGTLEVAALSFAGLAPTMAMALGTSFAAIQAGAATPLAYLLAMFGSLALAYVIVVFSRRVAASGVAFTWVGAVFGKNPGFVAGWLYAGGWMFATAVVLALSAVSLNALFAQARINIHWFIFFVILLVLAAGLSAYGVKLSLRVQLALELISVAALFLVMLVVVVKGGAAGNTLAPFNPANSANGWAGIGFGLIYGFSAFAGFEAGAALGLESKDPRRTIPKAIILSLLISAGFYVFVTYALSIGYGVDHASKWASDPTPLDTITSRYVSGGVASVIDAMVAVSAFSAGMGVLALSTRVFYGMSHHRLMPEWVRRTHPVTRTPYIAIGVAAVITLVVGAAVGLTAGTSILIGVAAGANTLAFILIYAVISIAAIWAFGRKSTVPTDLLIKVGIPIVAIVLLGFSFYTSIYPPPPFPYNLAAPLVIAWGLIGVVIAVIQRRRGETPTLDLEEEVPAGVPVGGAT